MVRCVKVKRCFILITLGSLSFSFHGPIRRQKRRKRDGVPFKGEIDIKYMVLPLGRGKWKLRKGERGKVAFFNTVC